MTVSLRIFVALVTAFAVRPAVVSAETDLLAPDAVNAFLQQHCFDCHTGSNAEGGLDLKSLARKLDNPVDFKTWVRIADRVHAGEMPPPDAAELSDKDRKKFHTRMDAWLREFETDRNASLGRVRGRRLTRIQVERTLHDLLGIDIPLANLLPEDPQTDGFATVASGQPMSHFQIEKHLSVVDTALEEAYRRATSEPDEWDRTYSPKEIVRRNPRRRTREPEMRKGAAVVWNGTVSFYGRLPVTQARRPGWYRYTINASALKAPKDRGVWCTVRSGRCVSSAPLFGWVGAFEAQDEPQEWTFETWMPDGHLLEVRPGDVTLKTARFRGGQIGTGEGEPQHVPGLAIHSVRVERIHRGPSNEEIRSRLFGDLLFEKHKGRLQPKIESQDDVVRIIREFAGRAWRHPANDEEIQPYVDEALAAIGDGSTPLNAIRLGLRAVLCSPRFLYFHETPGKLDDHALASRLSYFIWNSMPDDELLALADAKTLREPKVLREQTNRLLNHPRGKQFAEDLAAEWLDMNQINFTEPDRRRFREFDLIVQQSMLDETHTYLHTLFDKNLSVDYLIDSDFTFANSHLARYYGFDEVTGDELQKVSLKPEHHRGGMLTQGAILKVTANGTTTSPVVRGVWVAERLLGQHIPPPPDNIPAIEPDIRGAKTIRDMLAKHRSDDSCAACHRLIDPPGFALENFDPAGGWRNNYTVMKGRSPKKGAVINAGDTMPDGKTFSDIDEFRELVLSEPDALARNVAEKLMTVATGAAPSYTDRDAIESIVERTRIDDFGMRSLLHAVVSSEPFQHK